MKNFSKLLAMLLMGAFIVTIGCKEDDDSDEVCEKNDLAIGSCSADEITLCCDADKSCYYLYKGNRYENKTKLEEFCKTASISPEEIRVQLDAITARLIEEARSAALCQ